MSTKQFYGTFLFAQKICSIRAFVLSFFALQAMVGCAVHHSFDDSHDHKSQQSRYHMIAERYLDAVQKSISGWALQTGGYAPSLNNVLNEIGFKEEIRENGNDWPIYGVSMIGMKRLTNIREQLLRIMREGIHGDFLEAGVWRGGGSIMAKAVLTAYSRGGRKVHVVDSFQGLPDARTSLNEDHNKWSQLDYLRVSQDQVKENFRRFDLLDDQVFFHQGFFNESLTTFRKQHPNSKIAFLRMDGDMYESTMDIFFNVYDFVPVGGTIVIDDYRIPDCRRAVDDFFELHDASEEMVPIDKSAVYFIRTAAFTVKYDWYVEHFQQRQ
eukprot:TRINITY_DN3522_c0_g1_i4.p1 TRINITY_DN3522_c0_g1~~TRINITY_DN3522_c0_g1_i4.p1  ORF type:complete len:346 (-),score=34.51 TRINITY_DN3522_c0_g1_i4:353-1327(-)